MAEGLSYLYFKVASQILYGAYLIRVLGVLLYQMLTKCKTLPYESLAWASKSNITGRNCFRMQLFILNGFFFILFNFHLTRKIFSQALRLSSVLDTLINRTLVHVHTHVSAGVGITCTK